MKVEEVFMVLELQFKEAAERFLAAPNSLGTPSEEKQAPEHVLYLITLGEALTTISAATAIKIRGKFTDEEILESCKQLTELCKVMMRALEEVKEHLK